MAMEGPFGGGAVIPIARGLGLAGCVQATSWTPPADMTEREWCAAGEHLGKVERSVMWWLGDWWAFGEARYGQRKAIVQAEGWEGPSFQTCMDAAFVCRAFETSRRRDVLSFKHHREAAALPAPEADALLDWAAEPIASAGKPRSSRELRAEVAKRRNAAAIGAPAAGGGTCTDMDLSAMAAAGRRFGCIYADPPWLYDNQGTRAATGNHYEGLTVAQLCEMPVLSLAADDAHLHLWTTNAFLFECPRIFAAWGFEFRSSFVWVKPQMGIGNYWRNSHEILLTAIRGDAKRFNDHSLVSWLECDRGAHSAKPEQVRSMLERASPGPNLELFGRLPADKWTVWGNQIERNLFQPGEAA
jgi:N6-adenosine-specific RNA methylase IME4